MRRRKRWPVSRNPPVSRAPAISSIPGRWTASLLRRINWIITNWFRTAAYYASGGWRATWAGEGGGVLLNQCPHNLDLWQWLFGLPSKVRAHCQVGRYHNIEVEDDVTAFLEYPDGTTGVFITSTGEAPGTNRLEVTGERGRVVIENDRFLFTRTEANAMILSSCTGRTVDLPLNAAVYARFLKKKISSSTPKKAVKLPVAADDFSKSFTK